MQNAPRTTQHVIADIVAFSNTLSLAADGWAQLAPFGDHPGMALLRQADGAFKKFAAIQRLDRAAADGMVERFKSPWQRFKRYFTGCPIYACHPDVPAFARDYPDKTTKGMIVDLQVRDDGLYCKPVFTNEGSELVEAKKLRAFSGYWSAQFVGEENFGGELRHVFRPDTLKSAGLTNHPNLPVHLLNENIEQRTSNAEHRDGRNTNAGLSETTLPLTPALSPWGEGELDSALDQLRDFRFVRCPRDRPKRCGFARD